MKADSKVPDSARFGLDQLFLSRETGALDIPVKVGAQLERNCENSERGETSPHSNLALADNQDVAPDPPTLVLLGLLVVRDEVVDVVGLLLQQGVHPGCRHHAPDDTAHLVTPPVLKESGGQAQVMLRFRFRQSDLK